MANYKSQYTGEQIDEAIGKVLNAPNIYNYDGTVIIETAESPLGLKRLKENPTPILLDTEPTGGKEYYDTNFIEIEPIYAPPSTDDGFPAWYYGVTPAYSIDGGTTLKSMIKITVGESMSDNFMYFPTNLSSISGTLEFNILAVANNTVAEWVLANTEGVSV